MFVKRRRRVRSRNNRLGMRAQFFGVWGICSSLSLLTSARQCENPTELEGSHTREIFKSVTGGQMLCSIALAQL